MSINPAAIAAAARGDLDNFLVAATPSGIERQEKAWQTALVQSTNMPIDMTPDRAAFEVVGFKFGDLVDNLFVSAMLPEGWKREATDHSMWSKIVDAQGREHVSVFYKAAFYDRKAHANLTCRYQRSENYSSDYGKTAETVVDGSIVIQSFPVPPRPSDVDTRYGTPHYEACKAIREQANAWLDEHLPDHNNPAAYWDEAPIA